MRNKSKAHHPTFTGRMLLLSSKGPTFKTYPHDVAARERNEASRLDRDHWNRRVEREKIIRHHENLANRDANMAAARYSRALKKLSSLQRPKNLGAAPC